MHFTFRDVVILITGVLFLETSVKAPCFIGFVKIIILPIDPTVLELFSSSLPKLFSIIYMSTYTFIREA